jgi:diacylglycerol kinase family enzyme
VPEPPREVKPVRFVVVSTPSKAQVRFDGKPLGETPLSFEAPPGKTHYLQAEKAGYQRVEQELFGAEGEEKRVELILPTLKRGEGKATGFANAVSSEPGFLTVHTNPWSKVTVDGDSMGSTPLFKVRLSPGNHRLVLAPEGVGTPVSRDIVIKPGETLKLSPWGCEARHPGLLI